MLNFKSSSLYILALAALIAFAQASIDNKPVKVTHQNSGPSYDIDEVEKTKLTPEREEGQVTRRLTLSPIIKPVNNDEQPQGGENDGSTVGRINVRRILLIPMSQPSQEEQDWTSPFSLFSPPRHQYHRKPIEEDPQDKAPVWPFLRFLGGETQRGEESFSRPLTSERERENTPSNPQSPPVDIFQTMIEMMQQALSQAMSTPNGPIQDLNNKEAGSSAAAKPNDSDNKAESSETSSNANNNGNDANEMPKRPSTELESPFKPIPISNSTKEEIVEIDGKKYLKKTVVNRHVGENIIFMTKRLLFVPLNETISPTTGDNENKAEDTSIPSIPSSTPAEESRKAEPETTPTITTPSSTTPTEASSTTTNTTPEATTTTTTTTTTVASTTSSEPSPSSTTTTTAASSTTPEAPSTTPSSLEREAREASLREKIAETLEKASERILDKVTGSSN